jgi:TonB family protein
MANRLSSSIPAMRSQLGRKILATLMCTASLIASHPLLSQGAYKLPSSAVDAIGVRHYESEYGRQKPPWIVDRAYAPVPQYPDEAKKHHQTGSGLFRITPDLNTGSVVTVTVIKSTGYPTLDNSAVKAFRHTRWLPGRWKRDRSSGYICDFPPQASASTRRDPDSASAMTGLHPINRFSRESAVHFPCTFTKSARAGTHAALI